MTGNLKPTTSELNGRLWGARACDWADIQEGTVRPVYEEVAKRLGLRKGTQYLDVGCGAGMAMQVAATMGAEVSGVDAAEAMLEIAKSRLPEASILQGDLEKLPFDDEVFDAVTGFNSFQYAGNPIVALSEARRVTRPGGAIVIMTWGSPEGMQAATIVAALKDLLPPAPPGAPGPFALSDEAALRQFAVDAALEPIEVFDVDSPFIYPDMDKAVRGMCSAGVAARAMENTSEQAVHEAYANAFEPYRLADGSIRVGATFRCLLARP